MTLSALAQTRPARSSATSAAPPVRIEAQTLSGTLDDSARAEGAVELRRGGLLLRSDRLTYRQADETAVAEGQVSVQQDGNVFRGPHLTIKTPTFEGFFLEPHFDLARTGAGGRAERIDFQSSSRFQANRVLYTGCPRDGSGDPDWLITARELQVDLQANEAVARGAVVRFLGRPLMALPWISFPATQDRKSGWLTPQVRVDSRSGFELGVPYYWNIAPDQDATITPRRMTRRGPGVETEFRYLGAVHSGQVDVDLTPEDALVARSRHALSVQHESRWPLDGDADVLRMEIMAKRASDNDWWKDFRRDVLGLTPRLLLTQIGLQRSWFLGDQEAVTYGRTQQWQALQSAGDSFASPYQRSFQWGMRSTAPPGSRLEWSAEVELNRFTLPPGLTTLTRPTGQRFHLLGEAAWPLRGPVGWLVPRAAINAAAYELDSSAQEGRRRLARTVPTWSVDTGWVLEREGRLLGQAVRQTLEPRLVFVYTPWRIQDPHLTFDSAPRDVNFDSIFTPGDFSGVDRISDANHLNAGAVTRYVSTETGDELLRLALVQRYLFATQQITPEGVPFSGRFSDLFLLGATRASSGWSLEGSLRWNADLDQTVRSLLTARYAPQGDRSVQLTQRFTQGQSHQWEWSWRWPLRSLMGSAPGEAALSPAGCGRRWSSLGVLNYSDRDRRWVNATFGLVVDAGCWSGKFVAERVSLGPNEAVNRLSFQLNLRGLGGAGPGL